MELYQNDGDVVNCNTVNGDVKTNNAKTNIVKPNVFISWFSPKFGSSKVEEKKRKGDDDFIKILNWKINNFVKLVSRIEYKTDFNLNYKDSLLKYQCIMKVTDKGFVSLILQLFSFHHVYEKIPKFEVTFQIIDNAENLVLWKDTKSQDFKRNSRTEFISLLTWNQLANDTNNFTIICIISKSEDGTADDNSHSSNSQAGCMVPSFVDPSLDMSLERILTFIPATVNFEWTITNFFDCNKRCAKLIRCESPHINVEQPKSQWTLKLSTSCMEDDTIKISFTLKGKSSSFEAISIINYQFGIDGKLEEEIYKPRWLRIQNDVRSGNNAISIATNDLRISKKDWIINCKLNLMGYNLSSDATPRESNERVTTDFNSIQFNGRGTCDIHK